MSDFVWPHRRQPTRLPRPWDSPGKNTGVGYHFLLQCMKVKSEREVAQSCPTPSDPMDCSPPGSSVHGIFLMSLAKSILSFQRTNFSFHWSFFNQFHVYFIYFYSDLFDFFPLCFVSCSFSSCFRCKVRLFEIFLVSWGTVVLLWTFLLQLLLLW